MQNYVDVVNSLNPSLSRKQRSRQRTHGIMFIHLELVNQLSVGCKTLLLVLGSSNHHNPSAKSGRVY